MWERLRQWIGSPASAAAPPPSAAKRRSVDVGWLLDTDKAQFIWSDPRRSRRSDPPATHAKSVNYCPAIKDHESRLFEVACPIDVRLNFRRDDKGVPVLVNADGDHSTIRGKHLNQMLALVSPREWRHPDRPVVQTVTPYVFIADEPVWMSQMPPMGHYQADPWPSVLIGGRLPIHIWPRPMMWAFEWWDISRTLVLKRGDPWFTLHFETTDPSRPIRMFEAERTPALVEHMQGLSSVANYVDRTFSLFETAKARRPEQLLVRKTRGAEAPVEDG